jgi:hypothetical protein
VREHDRETTAVFDFDDASTDTGTVAAPDGILWVKQRAAFEPIVRRPGQR